MLRNVKLLKKQIWDRISSDVRINFMKLNWSILNYFSLVVKNTDHRTIRSIEELVVKTIEGSNLARSHGQELSFVLPNTEIETFPVLFKKVYIFN